MSGREEGTGLQEPEQKLFRKLDAVVRRVRTWRALRGLAMTVGVIVAVILVSFLLDRWLRLSVTSRVFLANFAFLGIIYTVWRHIARPQMESWARLEVAATLDRTLAGDHDPTWLTQRFATLSQLTKRRAEGGGTDSLALLDAAIARSEEDLRAFPLSKHFAAASMLRPALMFVVLTALPIGAAWLLPETSRLWFERWILASEERWPQETYLVIDGVVDGRLVVARGEPHELKVSAREDSVVPSEVEVEYDFDGEDGGDLMTQMARNDFRYRLPPVQKGGELWVFGGDDEIGPIEVVAKARPRIDAFHLVATVPQTGERSEHRFGVQDRDLAFLMRSRMRLVCTADQVVSGFDLPPEQAKGVRVERLSGTEYALEWVHTGRRTLSIGLTSEDSGLTSRPQTVTLGLEHDGPPSVTVRVEGVRDRITPTATVPLSVLARDDFGATDLGLDIRNGRNPRIEDAKPRPRVVLFEAKGETMEASVERTHSIEMAALKVRPGAFIFVVATSRDRCHLGPQTGQSRRRMFRVIEPEALFREIIARLEKTRARFRQALEGARAIRDALDMAEDLFEVAARLRRHRIIERQVWSTQRILVASARELELNKLIEQAAKDKLTNDVLEPLRRLYEDILPAQRRRFEAAAADGDEVQLKELRTHQAAIVSRMEDVLRNLKQWDSFVDFINQLDEIIKRQEVLRRATRDSESTEKGDGKKK